jgi:hypothetical protein
VRNLRRTKSTILSGFKNKLLNNVMQGQKSKHDPSNRRMTIDDKVEFKSYAECNYPLSKYINYKPGMDKSRED